MFKAALIIVVIAGVAGGLLWSSTRKAPPPPGSPTEFVLHRSSDGHFYADADVNGAAVRFLVDTGSSTIALSEADAKKAGITVAPGEFELIGEGASGMVRGKETTIDKLSIGGIEQQQVKAAVVEGATTSLLGADYLDSMDEIIIRKGDMTLRKAG